MATKRDPKQVFCNDGLFEGLKKALAERVLNAELDEHLDGEAAAGRRNLSNHRYPQATVGQKPRRPFNGLELWLSALPQQFRCRKPAHTAPAPS